MYFVGIELAWVCTQYQILLCRDRAQYTPHEMPILTLVHTNTWTNNVNLQAEYIPCTLKYRSMPVPVHSDNTAIQVSSLPAI